MRSVFERTHLRLMRLGVHLRWGRIVRARFRIPFDARSLGRLRAACRQALLEVADGRTEASAQFRQAPGPKYDESDQEDEEEMGRLEKTLEHDVILLWGRSRPAERAPAKPAISLSLRGAGQERRASKNWPAALKPGIKHQFSR